MTARKGCLLKLKKELASFLKDPPPHIPLVHVNERNMLEWHFLLEGPPDTPYEGGWYVAKLRFPHDYPFRPPAILMLSPSGRFKTNTRLCLSISDFHPGEFTLRCKLKGERVWDDDKRAFARESVSFILDDDKRAFARESVSFILASPQLSAMFPELPQLVQAQREKGENGDKGEKGEKGGAKGKEREKGEEGEGEEEGEKRGQEEGEQGKGQRGEAGSGSEGQEEKREGEERGEEGSGAAAAPAAPAAAPAAAKASRASSIGSSPGLSPASSSFLHCLLSAESRLLGRQGEQMLPGGVREAVGCEPDAAGGSREDDGAAAAAAAAGDGGGGEGSSGSGGGGGGGRRVVEGGDPEGALEELEGMLREGEDGEAGGEEGEVDAQGSDLHKWKDRLLMCKAETLVVTGDFDKALSILSSLHHHLLLLHSPSPSPSPSASTSPALTQAAERSEEEGNAGPWVVGALSWLRPQVTVEEVESFRVRVEGAGRHRARGAEQYKKRSLAAAVRAFSTAKSFVLSCAALHFNLAAALAALARHEEAVAACDEALALIATHSKARKRRADSLAALGRHAEAATEYMLLLQLQPGERKWEQMAEEQRSKAQSTAGGSSNSNSSSS
ncbi:unnamed protein product [Closterium sp. NIES-65]|nr:unnamed protein product [Closterium sp. NIES-65]